MVFDKNQITRRGLLTGAYASALAGIGFGLAGCGGSNAGDKASPSTSPAAPSTPQQRALWGSPDPVKARVGLIIGPPSMGLSQFLLAAKAKKTANDFEFTLNGVDYIGLSAAFNQGDYDICTLPSNIGPILYNNHELKNEYCVISINNLGLLYVMTTDPNLKQLSDLAGKTVYSYGEGGTPEYTIDALLKKNDMADSLNVEFKSSPLEVLNLMQKIPNSTAILPQPFVSLAKILVNPLYVPIDLTVEWHKAFADTGAEAVITTTIANKKFIEEHEQAVVEYLNMAGQSVDWTLHHLSEAAGLQEQLGTFLNNHVALNAMPYLSMVSLTGEKMRTALSGFLTELYKANPDSIGGALPGDDFYYLPPIGALDERFLQAGYAEFEARAGKAGG